MKSTISVLLASTDEAKVRYASDIKLVIRLQGEDGTGQIYVPHFEIEYSVISSQDINDNVDVPVRFTYI